MLFGIIIGLMIGTMFGAWSQRLPEGYIEDRYGNLVKCVETPN